eukprot:EST45182.1 Eukaryotic translation initiation factor 5B [Spironucleus salmonicida]
MPPKNSQKPIKKSDIIKEMKQEEKPKEKKVIEEKKSTRPVVAPKKATISKAELLKKAEAAKVAKEETLRKKQEEEELKMLLELEQQEQEQKMQEQGKGKKKKDKYASMGAKFGLAMLGSQITDEQRKQQAEELQFLLSQGNQLTDEERNAIQIKRQEQKKQKEEQFLQMQIQEEKEQLEDWEVGVEDDDVFGEDSDNLLTSTTTKQAQKQKQNQKDIDIEHKLNENDLRSPIICVLGHVDTGKTSLLDKIRSSTVQAREEGGITQQIGASFLSKDFVKDKLVDFPHKLKIEVPGLLIVDTPGHESFANLRSRGSSLADITVLVVDIMHGIEPQTIESINLLKERKTPFVIALNKIDRLYSWSPVPNRDAKSSIEAQSKGTMQDFDHKYMQVLKQFSNLNYSIDFWWKVTDIKETIPIIPTSAHTGEGLSDLLAMLLQFSQKLMRDRLTYTEETQCTILEVRKTEGFGYTLDCILVNGMLHRGDKIVLAGQCGPISTTISALLTPKEAKEIREASTSDYHRHESLQAAIGCKIAAKDLELAVAGTPLYLVENDEEEEILLEAVMDELKNEVAAIKNDLGVYVHSSSLGALEALIGYLRSENTVKTREPVPISAAAIGPVTKQTIQEICIQHDRKHPEYAVILAFDVNVDKEVIEKAKELKVKIFTNKIIYRLYDMYQENLASWHLDEREKLKHETVFPAVIQCLGVFHTRNPVICGFRVVQGTLVLNQPLAIPDREGGKYIGKVGGIQKDHKDQQEAGVGSEISVRIDTADNWIAGKDGIFDTGDRIYTKVTRKSIDIMKQHYRKELEEQKLAPVILEIKKQLQVQ